MSSKQKIKIYRRLDFRLTFWYSCAFLLTTFIICAFLYFRMRHNLLKEIDRFLFDEGRELAAILLKSANPQDEEIKELIREAASRRFYPLHFRIMDNEGREQLVSKRQAFILIPLRDELFRNTKVKKGFTETMYYPQGEPSRRIYTFPLYQEGKLKYIIQVVTGLKFMDQSLENFRSNIAQAFPLVLFLGALGGWLLARGSLKPIGEVMRTARRITASNLSERIALNHTGDELDELIVTINDMISRIENAFIRIVQFTADASHELRTPLCSMKGEMEVVLSQDRDGEEYKQTLVDCTERLGKLAKLLDGLLLLARADAGEEVMDRAPLALDTLLINLYEFFEPLAKQKVSLSLRERSKKLLYWVIKL